MQLVQRRRLPPLRLRLLIQRRRRRRIPLMIIITIIIYIIRTPVLLRTVMTILVLYQRIIWPHIPTHKTNIGPTTATTSTNTTSTTTTLTAHLPLRPTQTAAARYRERSIGEEAPGARTEAPQGREQPRGPRSCPWRKQPRRGTSPWTGPCVRSCRWRSCLCSRGCRHRLRE